jgi:hypothetical protein
MPKNVHDLYNGINMTKFMFGEAAIHVPAWLVAQSNSNGGVAIAGASRSEEPMFGSDKVHAFMIGELIVRPHFVTASDEFVGRGIGGFWTDLPSPREWLENGEILVGTIEQFLKIHGRR